MSAGRICIRDVYIVQPDESARVAAARMTERRVGALVVVDELRRPVGIVTDRDLTTRVMAPGRSPDEVRVEEVMTSGVRTVTERTPIEQALGAMRAGPFRRIPVVDDEGKLQGVLGLDDVLALLVEEFQLIGNLLDKESPTWED
ncbi:MAG: CBS domain-containing protein [Myxococcota bacterium]